MLAVCNRMCDPKTNSTLVILDLSACYRDLPLKLTIVKWSWLEANIMSIVPIHLFLLFNHNGMSDTSMITFLVRFLRSIFGSDCCDLFGETLNSKRSIESLKFSVRFSHKPNWKTLGKHCQNRFRFFLY